MKGARKLRPEQVYRIRQRLPGDSAAALAVRYGVTERTIVRVRNGYTYREERYAA
jgi:hypothetical protein